MSSSISTPPDEPNFTRREDRDDLAPHREDRDDLAIAMESLLTIYHDDDVDSDDEVIIEGLGLVIVNSSQNDDIYDEDEESSLPCIAISNEVRAEYSSSSDEDEELSLPCIAISNEVRDEYSSSSDEDEELSLPCIAISNEVRDEYSSSSDEESSLLCIAISNEAKAEYSSLSNEDGESSLDSEIIDEIIYFLSNVDDYDYQDEYSISSATTCSDFVISDEVPTDSSEEEWGSIPSATTCSYFTISDEVTTDSSEEELDVSPKTENSDHDRDDTTCPEILSMFSFDDFNFSFRRKKIYPLQPSSLISDMNVTKRLHDLSSQPPIVEVDVDDTPFLAPDTDTNPELFVDRRTFLVPDTNTLERHRTERPLSPLQCNRKEI